MDTENMTLATNLKVNGLTEKKCQIENNNIYEQWVVEVNQY